MKWVKRAVFWLPAVSILICFHDIWKTLHAQYIPYIGIGPFESFHHWMIAFDSFQPPKSAALSAKRYAYFTHFAFFFILGLMIDYTIKYSALGRNKTSRNKTPM